MLQEHRLSLSSSMGKSNSEPNIHQALHASMTQPGSSIVMENEPNYSKSRNPFDFLSSIFRKRNKETPKGNKESSIITFDDRNSSEDEGNCSSDFGEQNDSGVSFREEEDSPVTNFTQKNLDPKKLGVDMQHLRLSRHDNPVLQRHLSSSSHSFDVSCNNSLCNEDQDTQQLVNTDDEKVDEDIPPRSEFYDQMHEHLIRSPPPNPCSLPEISASSNVFMFPPVNKTEQSRSLDPLHVSSLSHLDSQNGNMNVMNRKSELNPIQTKRGSEIIDPNLRKLLDAQSKTIEKPGYQRSSSSPLPNKASASHSPYGNRGYSNYSKPRFSLTNKNNVISKVMPQKNLAPLKSKPF